jgi:isoquinoline 1-oxidoreductase subunit beta
MTSVEGASDLPYGIPNKRVSLHTMKTGVPVLWWRSVGHTHTAFTTEAFLDEVLAAAGKDPVEGRISLLGENARHIGVLERVAEMADWGGPVPDGRARGVAVHKSFGTFVAQIAELSDAGGLPRVHRVWVAVDCGVPINPNIIRAQMEGGVGWGLGAVLFGEITLSEGGHVEQSNFHDYRSLRINEMPSVEVAVIQSTEKPTGVGEPGVPPIGPAVANAWRVLTGQPVRRLPFRAPSSAGSLS